MRNAVIRKKRLTVERSLEDFLRMPQRIITGTEVYADQQWQTADSMTWLMPSDRDLELSMHTAWRD